MTSSWSFVIWRGFSFVLRSRTCTFIALLRICQIVQHKCYQSVTLLFYSYHEVVYIIYKSCTAICSCIYAMPCTELLISVNKICDWYMSFLFVLLQWNRTLFCKGIWHIHKKYNQDDVDFRLNSTPTLFQKDNEMIAWKPIKLFLI